MKPEEFRKLRERSGLTRKEAAYQAGYCYSSWTNFETGFRPVSQKAVSWLREYFRHRELQEKLQQLKERRQRHESRP